MTKYIKYLVDKRFYLIQMGEKQRIGFMNFIYYLHEYSDFNRYTESEKLSYFNKGIKEKNFYIDADKTVIFN